MPERLKEIDLASGIAIVLVVFGHMYFPVYQDNTLYNLIRTFVYKIHMPLFMTLSGFIAFYSFKYHQVNNREEYFKFIFSKFWKFFPPYIFLPTVAFIADLLLKKTNAGNIYDSVFNLFFKPHTGSAAFVWYLYVLFIFYCTLPLIYYLKKTIILLLLTGSFFLTNIQTTQLFCTDLIFRYLFFFLAGGIISINYFEFQTFIQKKGWLFLLMFIIATLTDFNYSLSLPFQLLSILFILTIFFLSNISIRTTSLNILTIFGKNTFTIYLFSSLFMNIIYLGIYYLNPERVGLISMIVIFLSGLFFPIFLKLIFNRIIPPSIYRL